jgi:hypothetical protein
VNDPVVLDPELAAIRAVRVDSRYRCRIFGVSDRRLKKVSQKPNLPLATGLWRHDLEGERGAGSDLAIRRVG